MPTPKKKIEARLRQSIEAWRTLRAEKSFCGMTLDQYEQRLLPSFEGRSTVHRLDAEKAEAEAALAMADRETLSLLNRVVNAIKADPDEGEDSQLYEAFGYVRKSDRLRALRRSRKVEEAAPAPTVSAAA